MFAVIIQSNGESGIRQTAVIPNGDEPLVYTRSLGGTTKLRGSAGAWLPVSRLGRADLWELAGSEVTLGSPVAVFISANDERDIIDSKPTTLLQKLARAVQGQVTPTNRTFDDVFGEVIQTADHKPQHLVRYSKSNTFVAPAVPTVVVERPLPPTTSTIEPPVASEVCVGTADESEAGRVWASLVVPPKPFYIQRSFNGLTEDEMYDRGLANGDNFLLSGHAGVGKTESVTNLANRLGLPLVRIEMHQSLSLADTEGRLLPTLDGGWKWHYSRLATAIRNGGVVLLNELSRSLPSNATLFLGILNEKQLQIETLNEVIPVHPKTIFIADQNIGRQYVGTREQDFALYDRFNVKLDFEDDPAIESQLIESPALLEIAHSLRFLSKQEPSKYRTRVGLRMLLNFVKQAKSYNFSFAVDRFIANFPETEREAVSMQFESRYLNIAEELSVPVGNYSL